MTNAEARFQAESLLGDIKCLVERLQSTDRKVCSHLNDMLEEAYASHQGLWEIDQPLNTAWSLYNISILEAVRCKILPLLTGLPATDENELYSRYSIRQSEAKQHGEAVQEVQD